MKHVVAAAVVALLTASLAAGEKTTRPADPAGDAAWQQEFKLAERQLGPTGRNPFFVLEPGFQVVLEGDHEKLIVTVLDATKVVEGVTTRVVEEREWKDGTLVEVSRNYFAICAATKDVFYFGEDVEIYKDGKAARNGDSWLAGVGGAKAGLAMPGQPAPGHKYYQEIAPGVAMDRAEIIGLAATLATPAGTFTNCLKTKEGTALDPDEQEFKLYAPGIGLIQDEDLRLTRHGFVTTVSP